MTDKASRKAAAAVLALSAALCACTNGNEAENGGAVTVSQQNTAPVNTERLNEEDMQAVNAAADSLLTDEELENKTVKWLAHYDLNPDSRGGSRSVALEMFESKYGGEIEYYPTTWESRWADLSTNVLGGTGIDFFPFDTSACPKGIVSGMFVPADDYIDLDSEIWQQTRPFMDMFEFGGKHYELCTGVTPEAVVIYSKKTVSENGLDDPWELYCSGEWNWDSFKKMMLDFVDAGSGRYGLDGYYYQKALGTSSGASVVRLSNGYMELTLDDPALEKAMQLAEEMYANGLFLDKSMFDWSEQPQMMGEGKQLFYFCGAWTLESAPEVWTTKISPEDAAMVPVPCCPDIGASYSIIPDGFMLCKGAANPWGAARYAECCIAAALDENARIIGDEKRRNDYKWTDELTEQYYECVAAAKEAPFYDMSYGISDDFVKAVTDNVMYNPFGGSSYAQGKEESREIAVMLTEEINEKLKALS
ncbi:MAG: extracellular solute-binding protein [Ruminococcus sp.]|nr:extracellular solute-binding protein [Ruminococcus sp.]